MLIRLNQFVKNSNYKGYRLLNFIKQLDTYFFSSHVDFSYVIFMYCQLSRFLIQFLSSGSFVYEWTNCETSRFLWIVILERYLITIGLVPSSSDLVVLICNLKNNIYYAYLCRLSGGSINLSAFEANKMNHIPAWS